MKLESFIVVFGPNQLDLQQAKGMISNKRRPRLDFFLRGLGGMAVKADDLVAKMGGGWLIQGRTPRRKWKVEVDYDPAKRIGTAVCMRLPRVPRNELMWHGVSSVEEFAERYRTNVY